MLISCSLAVVAAADHGLLAAAAQVECAISLLDQLLLEVIT
jgi:hypothetical protein